MRATNGKAWGLAIVGATALLSGAARPSFAAAGPAVLHAAWGSRAAAVSALGQSRRRRPRRRRMTYQETKVENGGTIEGVVVYRGSVPPARKIQIVKDGAHCAQRALVVPLIRRNEHQQVAEAVVFLGDIREGRPLPKPKEPARIDQTTCTFHPHVQAMVQKQGVEVVNNDPLLHNIQAVQGVRELFNRAQPRKGMKFDRTIARGGLVTLQCQAHDWMRAYIYVLWHPYFQVTQPDGAFKLTDVPPGEYELVVWQEHVGEQTMKVKVEAGETTKIEFELKPKMR